MIPYGEAAAVGGAVLNGVGQMQGARALASQVAKQQTQQMGIQKEADQATGAAVGNNNPAILDERNTAAVAAPGQAYLQSLNGYRPLGMSVAASNDFATGLQSGGNENIAANIRAARASGQAQTRRGMAASLGNLEDTRATLAEKARRLSSLYSLNDTLAASRGAGLRGFGNLLQVAGGVGAGAEGAAAGSRQPNRATDPAYAI